MPVLWSQMKEVTLGSQCLEFSLGSRNLNSFPVRSPIQGHTSFEGKTCKLSHSVLLEKQFSNYSFVQKDKQMNSLPKVSRHLTFSISLYYGNLIPFCGDYNSVSGDNCA